MKIVVEERSGTRWVQRWRLSLSEFDTEVDDDMEGVVEYAIRHAELRGICRVVNYLEGAGLSGFWSEKVKTAFFKELEEYDG